MILESILPLTLLLWMSLTFIAQWMVEWKQLQCERVLFEVTRNALDSPEKYQGRKEILLLPNGVEGKKNCRLKNTSSSVRFYHLQE